MRLSIRSLGWCLPALIAIGLGGCAGLHQRPAEGPPPLLLISLDGFRHDYFERAATPNLDLLIAGGLKADALVHAYPTKTFVTHYSMVTGLYAEHTGVVGNSMWDPRRRASFSLRDRGAVADGSWYGGEPIWVTAERQGLRAATYFWPGSEAEIAGMRPTWWMPYAHDTPHRERVDRILAWLELPPDERPSFLALYFSHVDSVGHDYGPDSPEVVAAVEAVDRDLGRLFVGLETRGLLGRMHVLVVSDHGMTGTDPQRTIFLDDYLDVSRVYVSSWGPAAHIWADELSTDEIVEALDEAHPRLHAWRREEIPARYHFRDHPRVPDLVAEADLGWLISTHEYVESMADPPPRGMHGWDPRHSDMQGIFIAHGPAFTAGSRIDRVEAIDLYELMAALLHLRPASNDGRRDAFAGVARLRVPAR